LRPSSADAIDHQGIFLARRGKWNDAVACYRRAIAIAPAEAAYYCDLAYALQHQGHGEEARTTYRQALERDPDWPRKHTLLAWAYAASPRAPSRHGERAVELATQACQVTRFQEPAYLDALAAAYAELGRFEQAAATARMAANQARSQRQVPLAQQIEGRLRLYEENQPVRGMPSGQ
jgi:Flp pilus assembly protein TadD